MMTPNASPRNVGAPPPPRPEPLLDVVFAYAYAYAAGSVVGADALTPDEAIRLASAFHADRPAAPR